MNNDITIEIIGVTSSGKTVLANNILNYLSSPEMEKYGYEPCFVSPETEHKTELIPDRIKRKIFIKTTEGDE